MKKVLLVLTVTATLFACNKDKDKDKLTVYKGTETTIHGGKAWSETTVDKNGTPLKLSLVLNDAVLNTVPVGGPGDGHDGHGNDLFIPLPAAAASATGVNTIMLNWNKNGHEPTGVYTLPHFDFHFYTSTEADVMGYTDSVKLTQLAGPQYIPANYVPGPPVPMMGMHYIDVTSPELSGAPFTQTFIYGSYAGKMVFMEPMITLNFLKNTTNFERSIPQPAKYQKDGYYPTKLLIRKHDGVTEITLDSLVKRKAS